MTKRMMNGDKFFLVVVLFSVLWVTQGHAEEKSIELQFFFSTNCKYCIEIKQEYLPHLISKYKDTTKINVTYFNTFERENFKLLLALERDHGTRIRTPAILIGNHLLVGSQKIRKNLEPLIDKYIIFSVIASYIHIFSFLEIFYNIFNLHFLIVGKFYFCISSKTFVQYKLRHFL